MAIDTAAKRRNVANLGWWLWGPGVTPDASPGQEWRQSSGYGYLGISLLEAIIGPIMSVWGRNYMVKIE